MIEEMGIADPSCEGVNREQKEQTSQGLGRDFESENVRSKHVKTAGDVFKDTDYVADVLPVVV